MRYLNESQAKSIEKEVMLLPVTKIKDLSEYVFDTGMEEYNNFLKIANVFWELNISKTFLLIYKETNELIAYMSLSADSVKLTIEEKEKHNISKVPFASIPALKVGKLAVNKCLSVRAQRKGYGSYMLEMARAYAYQMNKIGIACRFITVDADIEYDKNTPLFYYKNGFVENLSNRKRTPKYTISMRKDIME